MKRIVIDTNGYLRILLNDLPSQAGQIENLLMKGKQGKLTIYLPETVIFELVYILGKSYGLKKEDIVSKVTTLVSASYLTVPSKDMILAALKLYKNSNVSFTDCMIFYFSNSKKAELITFDNKLGKLASSLK